MKILLVDDSPAILDIYGDLLREEGYELITAGGVIEAIKAARAERPDIGIIDYALPDGNGAALTQTLLGLSETAHMLISLFSEVDHLRAALDAGAIDLISKADPKDLFLLRVKALTRQVEQWHYQQTMRKVVQAEGQEHPIRILLVDDSISVRSIYVQLLSKAGFEVEVAGGVTNALEVAQRFLPELVIVDFYMEDGTGDEVIEKLLSDRLTQDAMPFILTAGKDDVIERSLSAGAIDVLYKSDPHLVFLNRIQSMARYIRSQRQKVKLVEQLFQNVPVAMVEVAGDYVMQTNPGFSEIFGFEPYPGMEHERLLERMGLAQEGVIEVEQYLERRDPEKGALSIGWSYQKRGKEMRQLEMSVTVLPGDAQQRLRRQLFSVTDVTAAMELHQAEEQARHSQLQEQWLSSILASIPDGILVVDEDRRVKQSNPAAQKMSGYTADSLIGMELERLFVEAPAEGLVDHYLKSQAGKEIPVSLTIASLGGATGGEVVVLHDLEELLSAESAKRANKAKDEFLASMSHELRTPLTTIIGNSEMLAESALSAGQQELLRAIELSSRRQLALVSDILDLSKIESGKFEVNQSPFSLDQLVEEIAHIFSAQAQGRSLEFEVVQQASFDHQLMGDAQRIGQILINLLGNAFKFTSAGEVRLEVASDDAQLCFSVEDQGIGISAEVQERLFQPFEQADGTISRRFGGTGLGLHISKVLAGLMGGDITVHSEEGAGSRFELAIPLQISDQPVVVERERSAPQFVPLLGSVLLAEDTPEIQILVRRILQSIGVTVEVVSNGREAVDAVLNQGGTFDLILMDMQMPEMDGIEATEMLRQLGSDLPIIALTANVMQKHRDQFEQAGCNGFLSKPIDRHALYQRLTEYLSEGEGQAITMEEESIDPVLHEMFLIRATTLHKEMKHHLSASAWEELRAAAHSIKGSGATFGYPQLGKMGHAVCDAVDLGQLEAIPTLSEQLIQELEQVLTAAHR